MILNKRSPGLVLVKDIFKINVTRKWDYIHIFCHYIWELGTRFIQIVHVILIMVQDWLYRQPIIWYISRDRNEFKSYFYKNNKSHTMTFIHTDGHIDTDWQVSVWEFVPYTLRDKINNNSSNVYHIFPLDNMI